MRASSKRPAVHLGEVLADELQEIGISPTELARQLSVPANRISRNVKGKRAITGDTAFHLQSAYDLRIAESVAGAEVRKLPRRPKHAA